MPQSFLKNQLLNFIGNKMISVRQPSFSIANVLSKSISFGHFCSVEEIEKRYAEYFCVNEVVLLPSCRAGMSWLLQSIEEDCNKVVCPAFTCDVVWESILRAQKMSIVVDVEDEKFLMDRNLLKKELHGNYALLLCEIYGHTYDLKKIEALCTDKPLVRIVDMAMTVPCREHFGRLADNDVAFLSFGNGKCLSAGSGGMALSNNTEFMKKLRLSRNLNVVENNFLFTFRQNIKTSLFTFVHEPLIYSKLIKKIIDGKRSRKRKNVYSNSSIQDVAGNQFLSREWYAMPTGLSRNLIDYNLRHMHEYSEKRKILADCYHENLAGVEGIRVPEKTKNPLSYFTVLAEKNIRAKLINELYLKGIETNTLFFLPNFFPPEKVPNTWDISRRIINLPMNARVQLKEIKRICDTIKKVLMVLQKMTGTYGRDV